MYDATPHPTATRKEEVMPAEFCALPEPTPEGWERRNPDNPYPHEGDAGAVAEAESREDMGRNAWTRNGPTYKQDKWGNK